MDIGLLHRVSSRSTQIVATGLVTSSNHNISVESLQESGQLESKGHLTDDVTRLDDVMSVFIYHFLHSKLGLARCFTRILPWLD